MSPAKQRQGKKGDRKHGRCLRKPSKQRYLQQNRRFKNKLKRVRQSCGEEFAKEWRKKYR